LSIIKHVTLQKIVAHDFQYDPRINNWMCTWLDSYFVFVKCGETW
jgi:hypothetical protein